MNLFVPFFSNFNHKFISYFHLFTFISHFLFIIKTLSSITKQGLPNGVSSLLRKVFLVLGKDSGILLAESQNYTSAVLVRPNLGMIACFRWVQERRDGWVQKLNDEWMEGMAGIMNG